LDPSILLTFVVTGSVGIFSKSFTVEDLNVVVDVDVDDVVVDVDDVVVDVDDVVVDVVVVVVVGAVVDMIVVLVVDSEIRPSSTMNSVVVITGTDSGFSSSISFSPLFLIPNISKISFIILFVLSSVVSVDSSSAISVGSSSSSQTTFVIFLLTFLGIFSTMCSHSSWGTI